MAHPYFADDLLFDLPDVRGHDVDLEQLLLELQSSPVSTQQELPLIGAPHHTEMEARSPSPSLNYQSTELGKDWTESAHVTPALDAALHLSPQDTACVERAGHDLGALVDITGGSYERHLRLDLLQRDADAILGGWDPAAWSPEDMDTDSIFEHAPAAAEGAPAAAGRPPAPRPVPAAGLPATMHFVPVAPAPTRPAAAPAPAPTAGAGGGNFGRALDFAWMTPGPGDKPRQGQAKSNATILLTGARHSISVNSLLQEDNAIFERLLPPLLHARGLSLGHPQRLLLRAVVLALLEGIPSEVLAERYGLPQVAQLRADRVMDRAMIEELFPRRKKGTTKYDLCPGLAQVFQDYDLPWPGRVISDRDALYLKDKYDSKKGTHIHARSYAP